MLLVVKLDDPKIPAGPATVVAQVETVKDYFDRHTDRDGALRSDLRLWEGDLPVGTRVVMRQFS